VWRDGQGWTRPATPTLTRSFGLQTVGLQTSHRSPGNMKLASKQLKDIRWVLLRSPASARSARNALSRTVLPGKAATPVTFSQ